MLFVLKISMLVTYFRFGMDVLEDHFVADLSTKYSSSAEFMSFYGLLNFYVFIMVFVYSPSCSATLNNSCKFPPILAVDSRNVETILTNEGGPFMLFVFASALTITKDNPSFSMVNDSDEEVIYGSEDDEDTKAPLNNNSRSNRPNNNSNIANFVEDSD